MAHHHQAGDWDDLVPVPLPVSTRDPGEGAGLLGNGHASSSGKHVGTFDVEFDIEDDVLLNWQHARPGWCPWLTRRLPSQLQQLPEWWLRLSRRQRGLLVSASVATGVLLFCLAVVMAAMVGSRSSSSSHGVAAPYTPHYMAAADSPYCSWGDLYLPQGLRPSRYKLHISASLAPPFVVTGSVDISLTAAVATPCVVLHAAGGLNITAAALKVFQGGPDGDAKQQQPVVVAGQVLSANSTLQQVILQFPEAVPQPPLAPVLSLQFTYPLTEGLDGFYRSSFIDAANETKVMAATQFESVAARKAFPCFDEPAFKAVFEVKVSAPPPPVVVLSNMPLSHTHEHKHEEHSQPASAAASAHKQHAVSDADLVTYHFQASPPMSSYLVAWVVGELQHSELQCALQLPPPPAWPGHDHGDHDHGSSMKKQQRGGGGAGRNVSVRAWGTSDRVSQFGHALQAACESLRQMERLTKVAFPLPKLDLVAVPNFAAGAMENWGLLLYRERALLVDDGADDLTQRRAIATTVAHETAHQWTGNLVTLSDWNALWLNEGWATYLEAVVADAQAPGMGYLDNFFAETTSEGLEEDGSPASHPLSLGQPIRRIPEIDNFFDGVSYSKGAAVLRMLRAWVNRADSAATGLLSDDDAPSADADDAAAAARASTSEHWSPRLLRRLQRRRLQAGDSGSKSSSKNSSRVPVLVAAGASSSDAGASSSSTTTAHPWIGAHAHQAGGLLDAPRPPPSASGEALQVLPIDAPVPKPKQQQHGASSSSSRSSSSTATSTRALGSAALNLDRDKFILGLRRYLGAHAYGTANHTDLWAAMAEATGEDVADMMNTWTLRRGFPIVSVSLDDAGPDSSSGTRVVRLDQVPYHAPRTYMVGLPFTPDMYCDDWSDDPQDSSWWIPVPLRLPGANNFAWHSFRNCSANITVTLPQQAAAAGGDKPWVLANTGRFGFYRVNYSEPLWGALAAAAAAPEAAISAVDFAGLLDDAYALSVVRQTNITAFLALAKALGARGRPEYGPWATGLGWLQRMSDVLATAALVQQDDKQQQQLGDGRRWKDCLGHLRRFVTRHVTKPLIQNVQLPGHAAPGLSFEVSPADAAEVRLLRPKVLQAAGFLGFTRVTNMAVDLLTQQHNAKEAAAAISPDVTKAVYALAAASGSDSAYDTLQRMYEEAADAAHKDRLLRALARVTTRQLITRTLDYALSPAVRSQDVATVLTQLAKQGGLGFQMTWEFIEARADDILKKYGVDDVTYSLGRPLNSLAKLWVDEALLERLQAFAARQPAIFSPTFFEAANEARMINHDWLRFQGADACAWLAREARGR